MFRRLLSAASRITGRSTVGGDLLQVYEGAARTSIPVAEVIAGSVQGRYLVLFTCDREYLLKGKLTDFLEKQTGQRFLQVHHAHFVRPAAVTSLQQRADGPLRVHLNNGEVLPVSAGYVPALKTALDRAGCQVEE